MYNMFALDPMECDCSWISFIKDGLLPLELHKQDEPIITRDFSPVIPGGLRFYGGNQSSKTAILSTGYVAQVFTEGMQIQ